MLLAVRLVSGGTLLTVLAGFDEAITDHLKQLRAYFDGVSWAYLVDSSRGSDERLSNIRDLTRRRFEAVSSRGCPTWPTRSRTACSAGFPPAVRTSGVPGPVRSHQLRGRCPRRLQGYGHGALAMALSDYEKIARCWHPSVGPHLRWEAVVKPVYDPNELASAGIGGKTSMPTKSSERTRRRPVNEERRLARLRACASAGLAGASAKADRPAALLVGSRGDATSAEAERSASTNVEPKDKARRQALPART